MPLRHHTLVAWQRADDLFIELHGLTVNTWPKFERFERGSLAELGYCVHAAGRLGYLTDEQRDALEIKIKQASAALNGYIRSMDDRERG